MRLISKKLAPNLPLVLIGSLLVLGLLHSHAGENELEATQEGLNNSLRIDQFGGNEAYVEQIVDQAELADNNAEVTQQTENFLQVSQEALANENQLLVNQGQNNQSTVSQEMTGNGLNLVEIIQASNNVVQLFQSAFEFNSAKIQQQGDGNIFVGATHEDGTIAPALDAVQISHGGSNTLTLIQEGDGNEFGLSQTGVGINIAEVTQLGNGNRLGISQHTVVDMGIENRIEIVQDGGTLRHFDSSHMPTEDGGGLDLTGLSSFAP